MLFVLRGRQYDVTCFWWELMEMGRKFLLVGLFVWQPTQGSITQIAVGTIVAAVYLMIQLQAKPYKHATDDYLATASSFGLLMIFICYSIWSADPYDESDPPPDSEDEDEDEEMEGEEEEEGKMEELEDEADGHLKSA